jgi:hypothetical protein
VSEPLRLRMFADVEASAEIFRQLPTVEARLGINIAEGGVIWDYYDGPLSGEWRQEGEPTLIYWWFGGDRDYIIVEATEEQRAVIRLAESWEEIIEKAGDCKVVGRLHW